MFVVTNCCLRLTAAQVAGCSEIGLAPWQTEFQKNFRMIIGRKKKRGRESVVLVGALWWRRLLSLPTQITMRRNSQSDHQVLIDRGADGTALERLGQRKGWRQLRGRSRGGVPARRGLYRSPDGVLFQRWMNLALSSLSVDSSLSSIFKDWTRRSKLHSAQFCFCSLWEFQLIPTPRWRQAESFLLMLTPFLRVENFE